MLYMCVWNVCMYGMYVCMVCMYVYVFMLCMCVCYVCVNVIYVCMYVLSHTISLLTTCPAMALPFFPLFKHFVGLH